MQIWINKNEKTNLILNVFMMEQMNFLEFLKMSDHCSHMHIHWERANQMEDEKKESRNIEIYQNKLKQL